MWFLKKTDFCCKLEHSRKTSSHATMVRMTKNRLKKACRIHINKSQLTFV